MLLSHYMHTAARPGERFFLSEPTGEAYYDPERDAPLVVACAGGGGVAPYFSMARAIEAGDEDFALHLLYGSPDWDSIILRERIEAIRSPKVAVTHLLERERREGCEQGLITGARIEEAAGGAPYSLYICGSDAMYEALRDAANALRNKPVRIVREPSCTANRPGPGSPCVLTLLRGGARTEIPARTDETLLVACERAGIRVPNACRAGEVFLRPGSDRRTTAGRRQNLVHPCCAYPCGDVELELPV